MTKEKAIKFINYYFKKFGNNNIINEYSIDHNLNVYVYDITKNSNDGRYQIYIDSDPESLWHTIEDDDGNSVSLDEAVWEELRLAMIHLGLDLWKFRFLFNKRTFDAGLPFDEIDISENTKVRVFKESVESDELKWHRDRENRIVEAVESNNWFLQMDNELPKKLTKGNKYFIPEGVYHRVIKGKGDLKIKVSFK